MASGVRLLGKSLFLYICLQREAQSCFFIILKLYFKLCEIVFGFLIQKILAR